MPDTAQLDRDRIFGAGVVGRRIQIFRETGSTNDVVAKAADGGEPEGLVVFAESQTAGRGQFNRRWNSAAGLGLWFSLLLRPAWPTGEIVSMTPLVAVAVATALTEVSGIRCRIKPPNDIYCGAHKIVGILSEAKSGLSVHVVVGIGINVNHLAPDFPLELQTSATSLRIETDRVWEREEVATAVLSEIGRRYDPQRTPGADVWDLYEALSRAPVCDTFPE